MRQFLTISKGQARGITLIRLNSLPTFEMNRQRLSGIIGTKRSRREMCRAVTISERFKQNFCFRQHRGATAGERIPLHPLRVLGTQQRVEEVSGFYLFPFIHSLIIPHYPRFFFRTRKPVRLHQAL